MPPALQFEGISKEYRGFASRRSIRALDQFTLRVEQGEIFGFLGPNGAGKSTAIHLAMGFMLATQGAGWMLGKPFGHAQTRRRVGFLAENVALYHRRAEWLLRFYGALNGMGGTKLASKARDVLGLVKLEQHAKRNVSRFSRGMLQRVGLAQALVNEPDLLVLDEPTSALDPMARVAVRELLLELKDQGKTIFLSSHLLSEVELVCDRVAVLHRGKLLRVGRTRDLLLASEQTAVTARGIPLQAFPNSAMQDGMIVFPVFPAQQRSALERVWNLGGEVVSVIPMKRSLEEIFLELIAEREAKGNGIGA
jgi:ABC-2 type transport system ATP-binding protein